MKRKIKMEVEREGVSRREKGREGREGRFGREGRVGR